jgi:hypothetical protein
MPDTRYLITFSDGGLGMRERLAMLEVGDAIDDCGERYRIVTFETPPSEAGFGRALAELDHPREPGSAESPTV